MRIFFGYSLWYQAKKPLVGLLLSSIAILLCWSVYYSSQDWQRYTQHQQAVMLEQQHLWEHQGELNPHSAAHHGLYAFKNWQALSIFEPGLQAYLGSTVFLEAHRQNVERFVPAQDQLRLSELSVFTPAALLQHAVPLVIILLGYGLIAELRSQGTLAFLMTQNLSCGQVLISQVLVMYTLVLMMVLPALLYGIVCLWRFADGMPGWQYALFGMAYLLYWGMFIHLTLLASAYFKQARQALLLLLLAWMFNGLAFPRSLMTQMQLPAYSTLEKEIRTDLDALPDWNARTQQEDQRLRTVYKLGAKDPLPVNLDAEVLKASEKAESAVYQKQMTALYQQHQSQIDRYYQWRYGVPFLALQHLSQGVSQSDFKAHAQFLTAAESYREDFILRLNQDLSQRAATETFSYTANTDLWKSIKPFEPPQQPERKTIWQWFQSASVLYVWWLLSGWCLQFYKKRYEVLS